MPRPVCKEDSYEYRVKRILVCIRDGYEITTSADLKAWLETHPREVGKEFLDAVDSYMGVQEACEEIFDGE